MAIYKYSGIKSDNKKTKGLLEARSSRELYDQLKVQGIYAYDIEKQATPELSFRRLKTKELANFSRQIATMQVAGISLIKAVLIIKEQASKKELIDLYNHLYNRISQGYTLSQAMESCGKSFPLVMIHMFQAGEASGKLDKAASKMANYYDAEYKMQGKIKNALAYPIILAFVLVFVVLTLFTYVLPIFFEMYEKSGTELNGLTAFLKLTSEFVVSNFVVVILMILLLITIVVALFTWKPVARKVDKVLLKLPILGRLLSVIYTARFARTMGSLYSSGISMIQAVELSKNVINNKALEDQFVEVVRKIQSGHPLSYAIKGVKGIESKLSAAIYVGEESGQLSSMLESLGNEYETESQLAMDRLLTYIEPMMIISMACIIGPVLVAVVLPMFDMYTMIG